MSSRLLSTVLLLVLLVPTVAMAARPELVARGGVTAATYHQDDLYADAREGMAFGLGSRVPLGEGFALMPEVWYQQKGFKSGTLWEQIHLQGKLETISVPVLASYWFEAKRVDPRVYMGLAVDFVLTSEIARRDDDSEWLDVTDQDESMYWSLIVGGGARFFGWLDVDIRYQSGLTAVTNFDYEEFDDMIPESQEFDDAKDRTWILTAGVWF